MAKIDSKKLANALNYLDRWLEFNAQDSEHLVGVSVAIQHKDKIVFSKAYGYANLQSKEKMTPDHAFRIASHSKTFTATAISLLYEQGKLRLDDKVSAHLEWFRSENDPEVANITIRELLNHTSGLSRDSEDADFWQNKRAFPDDNELKEYIKTAKLVIPRNARFKYSNYGYGYLGMVVTAASGQTYNEFVTENIIKPLALKRTAPELDDRFEEIGATGYGNNFFGQGREEMKNRNTKALSSAAGFYSTAEEMCKFYASHFHGNESLLKDSTKREVHHGYWEVGNNSGRYGLGFENIDTSGNTWVSHGGGFPGFITNTRFLPEEELVIVVLTNNNGSPLLFIKQGITSIINYFQITSPDHKGLEKLQGRFESLWEVCDVLNVNGKLVKIEPRFWTSFDDPDCLEPTKDSNAFLLKTDYGFSSPEEKVEFSFNDDGKLSGMNYAGTSMKFKEKL